MSKIEHFLETKQAVYILESVIEALELLEQSDARDLLNGVGKDTAKFDNVIGFVCRHNEAKSEWISDIINQI